MHLRSSLFSAVALFLTWSVGAANAEKIVVADVAASDELDSVAGGLSVLLRSYVGNKSQRVSRGEIRKAVLAVGADVNGGLSVPAKDVAAALAVIDADRWLASSLRHRGATLELQLTAFDRDGNQTGNRMVSAPLGDYDALARAATETSSKLVGAIALKRPKPKSYAALSAIGSAATKLNSGDNLEAARQLSAAPIRIGFELRAVREIAAPVIADERVPLDLRMNAALVAGDLDAAKALVAEKRRDPRGIALDARIKIIQVDHAKARSILAKVKRSKLPFVLLAKAALADELGKRTELARHFIDLLGADPYIPALALGATLRPDALGSRGEAALLSAAAKVASSYPALASRIGARALRGARTPRVAFELIDTFTISEVELKELTLAATKLADEKLKARILGEVAVREGRLDEARKHATLAINLDPDNARAQRLDLVLERAVAVAVGELIDAGPSQSAPTAKKTMLADEKRAARMKHLADDLGHFLAAFSDLDPSVGKVVLVPRAGSHELAIWPRRVHPAVLRTGLDAALAEIPLLTAIDVTEISAKPSRSQLEKIANDYGAGGVLVYGVRTDGSDAKVSLLFYSKTTGLTETYADRLRDAQNHGVVSWNPAFVVTVAAIGLVLLVWLVWLVVRGNGSVRVELKGDPAAERGSFSVLISRRNRCPVVTDPKAHTANVNAAAKASRFRANNVGAVEEFERIPPGGWFIHVFGTFEKAGESRCLPATTVGTKVKRSRVSIVNVDLVPKESEFHILVTGEGGPASGAQLWLSTEPAKRFATDVSGKAVIFAMPGDHTLHVSSRGQEVTRKLTAYGSKVSTIHMNLVRERRLAEVAEGLDFEFTNDASAANEDGPVAAISAGGPVSAVGSTAFPPLSEETPTPRPSPLIGAGPSVDSFRAAAEHATALPADEVLTGLRRYRASGELGRGAMGVVYRAVDQVLDREVALKVMSRELHEHPAAAKMFEQEGRALAALNHPNVVTVFDQGRDGEEIFIVMELVEGETLEDVLQARERLPIDEAANIGEQLGRGLSYAHSRRVIHRDVKPGNVFITPDGTVKIGDFGLARVLKEVQIKKTEIKGTPLYMAPEQIRGSDIDFRADIYALGCTMYEVLAGRPPFIEGEILWHHIYTEPEPLSAFVSVPAEIEALIMKCIAKEKSNRIASADRISEVFGAIRRGS